MERITEFYNNYLKHFQDVTSKPEIFLNIDEELNDGIKTRLKDIYDFSKNEELKTIKSSALPELIVKNFDLEQIWQQIELQNDSLLTRSVANVGKLMVAKDKLLFPNLQARSEDICLDKNDTSNDRSGANEDVDANEYDLQNERNSDELSLNSENFSGDENNEEDDEEIETNKPSTSKKSIVDDEFFKLDEMENFLKTEERKLNEPDSGNDSDNESASEASVDLFEENSDDDDDEDADDHVKTAKYKDFFVAKEAERKTKRNKFFEQFENNSDEMKYETFKSTFEERQERLKRKIDEIEDVAVSEKPWQLQGEISAEKRPQNSLLEEIVEFDLTSRPAPIITEQTSLQLEDIIKQRIKDKVFDSVERKIKPVDTPLEYKKKLVLDQEKNKDSLAQIYEKEYLMQKTALDPENIEKEEEEPALHKDINKMMKDLFKKLDALSNFHFTPKLAAPELRIVSNLPAISMEEVAPVAASDAALLAPEEVKGKPKADVVGKGERTVTDKKRERRQKKIKQKIHAKRKSKMNEANVKTGKKQTKGSADKIMLDKVVKSKNVNRMNESAVLNNVKSSTAFFTQLEEQVKSQIKNKVQNRSNVKQAALDAKKIKL